MPRRHSNPRLSKISPSKPAPEPTWTRLKLLSQTPAMASRPETRTISSSRTSPPKTAAQDLVSPSPPASSPSTAEVFGSKTILPSVPASSSNFRQPMFRSLQNIRPDPLTHSQIPTPAKKPPGFLNQSAFRNPGPDIFQTLLLFRAERWTFP